MARSRSSGKVFRTGSRSAGARIEWFEDTLTPGLAAVEPYIDEIVSTTFRFYESQVENAARRNAPWQDQTGNARNGLLAQSGREGKTHYLVLAHRVPYGIWLEVRWGGKYATVMPTIEAYAPQIMGTINGILEKFNGRVV